MSATPQTARTVGQKQHHRAQPRTIHRLHLGRRRARRWFFRLSGLFLLLVLPVRAMYVLSGVLDIRWVLGALALVSVVTALTNYRDKCQAQADRWRTPESKLHFLELIGGWPAAFVIQRIIRHKTAKPEYQSTFWLIVILHQYLAIDFVQAWRWTRWIYETMGPLLG